jgi:hypothetical protein
MALRHNGEEHAARTWQHRRVPMKLMLGRVRCRQHRRLATGRRHAQQACGQVGGGEYDRVVIAPARSAQNPGHLAHRRRRTAGGRNLLDLLPGVESDPPAIGRKEWLARVRDPGQCLRFELIDPAYDQLPLYSKSRAVHDRRSVVRDADVTISLLS